MDSIWGTLAVATISSGSALLAGYLTNRSNEKRLSKQIELERQKELDKTKLIKAEELYSELLKFKTMAVKTHLQWVGLARGEVSLEDLIKGASEINQGDPTLLEAKLGIYFPELLEKFEGSRDKLNPANDCYFKMTRGTAITKEVKLSYVQTIIRSSQKFDVAIDELLKDLSKEVRHV